MSKQSLLSSKIIRPWWAALLATLVIGLFLVFWLPTRFSPPPVFSESYLFGFNNHLCEVLFGTLVIAVAVLAKLGGLSLPPYAKEAGYNEGENWIPASGNSGLTRKLIVVCLGIDAVLCLIIYWLARGLGGLNDGVYFLDRIHLVARGEVPYRDFEFLYGSAPLYGSLAIGRLLHTSPDNGYYLIWGCGTILGILLLWLSIRWLEMPPGGKRTVFLLYYSLLSIMIFYATLNYISLRYTLPLFAVTGLCRIDRDARWLTRVEVILFALTMTAILLGFSPEEGLVYAIAVCLYLPVRRYYAQRSFALDMVVLIAVLAALFAIVAHTGTFRTMSAFSAGALNLPVFPGPNVLFAFAAVLGMVFYVATRETAKCVKSNVAFAVLYGLGMLPGALGRCDNTHIAGYLLSVLVCAMLLSRLWLPMWRIATVSFVIFFLLLPFVTGMLWQPPVLSKALFSHLYQDGAPRGRISMALDHLAWQATVLTFGKPRGTAKMAALRYSYSATSWDPRKVFPGASPEIAVPFEYLPNKLSNYQAPGIDEGYYMGTLNILTPTDVERKIDELRTHPGEDLVYPDNSCGHPNPDMRVFVGELLFLPWVPQQKHQMTMLDPYCNYIRQHYEFLYLPSPATFGYGLMRRKSEE